MPLAYVAAVIARAGKDIGDHGFVGKRGRRRAIADPSLARNASGEQSSARGCGDGRAAEAVEKAHARGGQPVDVRCANLLVAVAAQHPVAETVGKDEYDVGAL